MSLDGGHMSDLPQNMIAIDSGVAGRPEVLVPVSRPVPELEAGEVLIRVEAAGVNRADIMQRQGIYPPPLGASTVYGLEAAGTVVALGAGVDQAYLGQAVCALLAGGGYAEYCAVNVGHCLPVPNSLTMVEAAALPEALFTVWTNLFERAYAVEGDTVLVHGGTGGIGTMAISLGRLFGLKVIVTCGSDEKCAAALKIGAAHAVNYKSSDFVEEVGRLTGGKGVHAVLDLVGGDYVPRSLKCLAVEGRHVTIAVPHGVSANINLLDVMMRRLTITGSTLRAREGAFKTLVAEEIARIVWPHVVAGRLKPIVDRTFPLQQAAQAHEYMDSGQHIGKIVLTMR